VQIGVDYLHQSLYTSIVRLNRITDVPYKGCKGLRYATWFRMHLPFFISQAVYSYVPLGTSAFRLKGMVYSRLLFVGSTSNALVLKGFSVALCCLAAQF
jgi:hypothetical protein